MAKFMELTKIMSFRAAAFEIESHASIGGLACGMYFNHFCVGQGFEMDCRDCVDG